MLYGTVNVWYFDKPDCIRRAGQDKARREIRWTAGLSWRTSIARRTFSRRWALPMSPRTSGCRKLAVLSTSMLNHLYSIFAISLCRDLYMVSGGGCAHLWKRHSFNKFISWHGALHASLALAGEALCWDDLGQSLCSMCLLFCWAMTRLDHI